jgi:arylsulfatase
VRERLGRSDDGSGRPNILLFMTDQHRWDALGCSGGWVETPNIDRLASEGVRFANAYTNAPACIPARMALATGHYPHRTGVRSNKSRKAATPRATWMRAVRDAGYGTSVFGKTHLHRTRGNLRDRAHALHAFGLEHVDEIGGPRAMVRCRTHLSDRWVEAGVYDAYCEDLRERYANKPWVVRPSPLPLELYPDVYVGRQAAGHLSEYEDTRPWFCWVSFGGPHEPWDTPEPYASRYDPGAMPPPVEPEPEAHDRPRGRLDERRTPGGIPFEPGEVARLRADYAGNVTLIDDQVGEVLRVVEERGELDNTIMAFTSDHGEMNGDHGMLYKHNFLGPSVRIPLVVRLPPKAREAAGAVCETPVELMDLGATLAELAGAAQGPDSDARSLVALLRKPSWAVRDAALSELGREAMLATQEWKLAVNRRRKPYLLHDLRADPDERRNLAGLPDFADVESELVQRLRSLRRATAGAGRQRHR